MKYATITGQIYLRADSQASLDPEKAIQIKRGESFADDHPLVVDRPDLFTDTKVEDQE